MKAALAVNSELVLLYWRLGRDILVRQKKEGWGTQVIDRLSADLRAAFPEMQGFSPRNLKYMRALATAWPDEEIVQQAVARLPWGHNVRLLDRIKTREERLWYARQAVEHGWSRAILEAQIETGLYKRAGKALTNFKATLPPPQSDLAQQTLKDPYIFDFLTLGPDAVERDVERGLIQHVRDFLLELGVGFALNAPLLLNIRALRWSHLVRRGFAGGAARNRSGRKATEVYGAKRSERRLAVSTHRTAKRSMTE